MRTATCPRASVANTLAPSPPRQNGAPGPLGRQRRRRGIYDGAVALRGADGGRRLRGRAAPRGGGPDAAPELPPGGLFSRSDGSGRAEASPGARDRLGLAAQLDLDADAVGRWRRALAPPRPSPASGAGPARRDAAAAAVITNPTTEASARPRPASQSKNIAAARGGAAARGLPERPFSQLGDAGMWLARSFRPAFGCDGRLARPVVGRGARSSSRSSAPARRTRTRAGPERGARALAPRGRGRAAKLPSRALPACPAYDDDLYAASAARAAVAKAVHAYGKAHAGRLREAFELVGALWLHDATRYARREADRRVGLGARVEEGS